MVPIRKTCLLLFIVISVQLFDGCAISGTAEILRAASACRTARSVPWLPVRKIGNRALAGVLSMRGGGINRSEGGVKDLADMVRSIGEELRFERIQDLKLLRLVRDRAISRIPLYHVCPRTGMIGGRSARDNFGKQDVKLRGKLVAIRKEHRNADRRPPNSALGRLSLPIGSTLPSYEELDEMEDTYIEKLVQVFMDSNPDFSQVD